MAGEKNRVERLKEGLENCKSVEERIDFIAKVSFVQLKTTAEEKKVICDAMFDIFFPSKTEDGVVKLDEDKLRENLKAVTAFNTKLLVQEGKDTIQWLDYLNKTSVESEVKNGKSKNASLAVYYANNCNAFMLKSSLANEIAAVFMDDRTYGIKSPVKGVSTEDYVGELFASALYDDSELSEIDKVFCSIGRAETDAHNANGKAIVSYINDKAFSEYGKLWLTPEEEKTFVEEYKSSLKEDEKKRIEDGKNLFDEMSKQEVSQNPASYVEKAPKSLMSKNDYFLFSNMVMCGKMLENNNIGELDGDAIPTYEELSKAKKDYDNYKTKADEKPVRELLEKTAELISKCNAETYSECGENTEAPKVKLLLKVEDKLDTMLVSLNPTDEDYVTLNKQLLKNEKDYLSVEIQTNNTDKAWENAYGDLRSENILSKDEFAKVLSNAGISLSISERKGSTLSNAYMYKAINDPFFDPKKGMDAEYARGCGSDYIAFLSENPVYDTDDKELAKKSAREQGKFYRRWADYALNNFTLMDYSESKNAREGIKTLQLMEGLTDLFQNHQGLVKKGSEFAKEFKEGFGGEKDYEEYVSYLKTIDSYSMGAKTIVGKDSFPHFKGVWKSFFEFAKEESGSLEGKKIFDLNPYIFNLDVSSVYMTSAMELFLKMPPKRLNDYLYKGGQLSSMEENALRNVWNESKKSLSKDYFEIKNTVLNKAGLPVHKKDYPGNTTPLDDKDEIVIFSEPYKAKMKEFKEQNVDVYRSIYYEFHKANPNVGIEGFDYRDIAEILAMTVDDRLSPQEKQEQGSKICQEFFTDENKRKLILDKFFDKLDSFAIENYDMSMIDNKDEGERGEDGLTESERDMVSLYKISKSAQAFLSTLKALPEYSSERYPTFESRVELINRLNSLKPVAFLMSDKFRNNGIKFNGLMKCDASTDEIHMGHALGVSYGNDLKIKQNQIFNSKESKCIDSVVNIHVASTEDVDINTSMRKNIETVGNICKSGIWGLLVTHNESRVFPHLYIDGINAHTYVQPYIHDEIKAGDVIAELIKSGEHRLENVDFLPDRKGNMVPTITSLVFDYPANNVGQKTDKDREKRLQMIRNDAEFRLGPDRHFSKYASAKELYMTQEAYDRLVVENPPKSVKVPSFEERAKSLQTELQEIDKWYHRDSSLYKNVVEALDTPEDVNKVLIACDKYISKYFEEENTYQRKTDLGNGRMQKILEIKAFYTEYARENGLLENRTMDINNATYAQNVPGEIENAVHVPKEPDISEINTGMREKDLSFSEESSSEKKKDFRKSSESVVHVLDKNSKQNGEAQKKEIH